MSQQFKNYTIEGELGKGGMATVHLAIEAGTGRKLAIKFLLATIEGNESFVRLRPVRYAPLFAIVIGMLAWSGYPTPRVAGVALCGGIFFWLLFVVMMGIPQPPGWWPPPL